MPTPAVPDTYRAFFDDAATFPPGRAPLEDAVRAYLARRPTPLAAAVGPMVLPVADLPATAELLARIDPGAAPVPVSAVVPLGGLTDAHRVATEVASRITVTGWEVKTASDDDLPALVERAGHVVAEGPAVWLELVADQIDETSLAMLGKRGVGLKFRTGGLTADLFPSAHTLAEVIQGAVRAGVRFKLTAGLHEALRFTSTVTGLDHHGFLNIAAATAAARAGADTAVVAALLGSTDGGQLTPLTEDGAWRRSFTSFGTCSIGEPVESLQRLGLLDPELLSEA
ncbi:hypothetical protein J4H86_24420 [Spiractinospora alimapuensis]|uniref:hypothetical protein n=1 Tax=Spiractinospora alimapuensis TaxID=2820884 RepID=UPI001F4602F3|nr:hypothetical protein [Spiractinospora alimapuensis]QVQ51867.1 hypothetical protein J4H86_24420 [Spiractinospora alimapuensis]